LLSSFLDGILEAGKLFIQSCGVDQLYADRANPALGTDPIASGAFNIGNNCLLFAGKAI
jgi:hypothetical protein